MAVDVVVPQMGESVLEGTILEWKVKPGDKVKLNQPLVELMTDKVNIEIPAEVAGTVTELLANEGDVVAVGARIAIIDDGGSTVSVTSKPDARPEPQKQVAVTASAAVSSPPVSAVATTTAVAVAPRPTGAVGRGKMSPKVKMMVRQYSLDPSTVEPTGVEGRVTIDDVLRAIDGRSTTAGFTSGPIPAPQIPTTPTITPNTTAAESTGAPASQPRFNVEIPKFEPLPANLRERREPLTGVRKLISEHMLKSIRTSTHVTTFEDIDMTDLVAYRGSIKESFRADYGANITYLPFICKAVAAALKEHPKLNASMTETEITYKNYYNIGIAVARDDGLIVPVIKDADKKSIIELAVEINQLGEKARTNRLLPDDVSGGTFSLTNAGMFGATASTPIINQPQVAILGIHAITKRAWVVNDEIKIRNISTFGLSFDHRLIDGHEAVQFLHRVHEFLADTNRLLLYLR